MFAVEEKSSRRYIGRVGPWCPPGWPGFEVGWGIDRAYRGKGYAVEAARASIDWVFATFEIDEIIHCIDSRNAPSKPSRGGWGQGEMAKSIYPARPMSAG